MSVHASAESHLSVSTVNQHINQSSLHNDSMSSCLTLSLALYTTVRPVVFSMVNPDPCSMNLHFTYLLGWLGGSVVRALARDRKVASSTPGQSATK